MARAAQYFEDVAECEDGLSLAELGREEREYISIEVGGTIVHGQQPTMFYLSKPQKQLIADLQAEIRSGGGCRPERLNSLLQQLEHSGLVLEAELMSLRQHMNRLLP